MPPLVVDVMNGFRSDLLRQDAAQMRSMTERWRQVEANLQAEVLRFTERVRQGGLTVGQLQSRQFQLDRYVSLLGQVRRELDAYTDYAEPVIVAGQRQAAATGINAATAAINAVASEAGTRIAFDVLPVNAVQNLVGLAGNGSPLRTLLVGSYGAGADGMFNELINATAKGQNPRVTARNMVRQGLSQSLDRMLLTARTEQLRVFRESSRQQYINSGVVTQYRRLATKSPRTCLGCLLSDGELYELEDSLREHPGGRCIAAGTLIATLRGLVPIELVRGGDLVLTHTGRYKRVTHTAFRYYNGNVVTLVKDGHSVTLTPEHRVYTGSGWIEARTATTFWTLKDVLRRASSLNTVQPSEAKKSSFLRSLFSLRPVLCHRGSSSTASLTLTNAKSILNTSMAYSLIGNNATACMASSNSFSLSLEYLRQFVCLVKAALALDSRSLCFDRNRPNASGFLSIWRFAASRAEMGLMLNLRIRRISDLVLMLASAVNSLYVAPSSMYRRRSQVATGSHSCSDNLSIQSDVDIDARSCIDFFKPSAFARCWTDLVVRPSNILAMLSAFIDQKLSRITLSSWALHDLPDMGIIVHHPSRITQKYSGVVYDLAVEDDHSFIAGGVVVHNCTLIPVVKGFPPVKWETGQDWLLKQSPATQRSIMGPGRFKAWQEGRIDLPAMVTVRRNSIWGDSVQPTPLRDLVGGERRPPSVTPPPVQPPEVPAPTPQPVEPVFDRNDPVQVRQRIAQTERKSAQRMDEIEGKIIGTAQEMQALEKKIGNLTASYEKRKGTEQAAQVLAALEKARQDFASKSAEQQRNFIEQKQVTLERDRRLRELVGVGNPGRLAIQARGVDTSILQNWQDGIGDFNRLVSSQVIGGNNSVAFELIQGNGRAFFDPLPKSVNVTSASSRDTVVHELGHWLEEINPDVHRKALEFYDRRTQGYALEWLGPGYDQHERTRRDKFIDEYMGKDYRRQATELVSMGIEYLHTKPATLARRDPDMFDWVFNLVRGQ